MNSSPTAPSFSTHQLSVAYRDNLALNDVSVSVNSGHFMAILGPNGAGKSTLIKAAMGLIPTLSGTASFFGQPLGKVRRRIGYMPQSAEVDWDFPTTVRDVVTMGTYGQLGWIRRPGPKQMRLVDNALEMVGLADLAHRQISQLSGGQKQRTFVARILAQDPEVLIMDEPFAGIDVASEQTIMTILRDLNASGKTIVIVHHDLSTVTSFATDVTVLQEGKVVATGPTSECFTAEVIGEAYGISHAIFETRGVR